MHLIDQFLRERGKGNTDAYQSFVDDLKEKVRALPTEGDAERRSGRKGDE
jgi:hypothetical protein